MLSVLREARYDRLGAALYTTQLQLSTSCMPFMVDRGTLVGLNVKTKKRAKEDEAEQGKAKVMHATTAAESELQTRRDGLLES